MKKMFVLIGMLVMISVSSFADQSCPVRGADGVVAALTYSDKQSHADGKLIIEVSLSAPSKGETTVFVEVRDSDGNMLGTATMIVCEGKRSNTQCTPSYHHLYENSNLKRGEYYSLNIAKASCSWY